MITLKQAKNQVANKYGYVNWNAFVQYEITKHATTVFWQFIDEAAELYANSKWNEAIDLAEENIFSTIDESRERVSKLKKQ